MESILKPRPKSKVYLFLIAIGTIITGTVNSLIMKLMDITKTDKRESFFNPVVQTFLIFCAELITLFTFYTLMKFSPNFKNEFVFKREIARKQGIQTKSNPLIPFLPAFIDLFGSVMQMVAIYTMNPSVYVMIRGGVPVTSAILSVVFLKTKLYAHHTVGLLLVLIGVACASVVEAIQEGKEATQQVLGLTLALISLLTTGIQYIFEEKIMSKYYFHPLKLVGLEGLWGVVLAVITAAIISFVSCDPTSEYCNWGHLEDIPKTAEMIFGSSRLIILFCVAVINSSFFNFFGVSITNNMSPLPRTILSLIVILLVWGYCLAFLHQGFYILQAVALVLLIAGNLIYQEIIEIPGINQNTKKNQEKRALFNESMAVEDDDEDDI